jgi:hypothetical protein
MSDEIVVKQDRKAPHADGTYPAVCVDIINLGKVLDTYPGRTPELVPKCALVFQTNAENPDTHEPLTVHTELTVSFGRKAKLRKLLESWRGKMYSDEEVQHGIPLHKLEKVNALINIIHKVSGAGNTYAVIDSIMPPIKGSARIEPHKYTRAEFWEKKKTEYAEAAAKHEKQNAEADAEFASAVSGDDDLPF